MSYSGPVTEHTGLSSDGVINARHPDFSSPTVHRAISEAVVQAKAGHFPAGTYTVSADITVDLSSNPISIYGDGVGITTITSNNTSKSIKLQNADNLTLRGITFNNCRLIVEDGVNFTITESAFCSADGTGVTLTACGNGFVRSCFFEDLDSSGLRMNKNGDASANACRNIVVSDNYFRNVTIDASAGHGAVGVTGDGGNASHDTITISNNIIDGVPKGVGIIGDGVINNYTVCGNQLKGDSAEKSLEGITFGAANNVMVTDNRILGNQGWISGILFFCGTSVNRGIVRSNYIENVDNGVMVHYPNSTSKSTDCVIDENYIKDTNQGILIFASGSPTITRCWIGSDNVIVDASTNSINRNGMEWAQKMTLGNKSLWVDDTGDLRIVDDTTMPVSADSGGTVVGTQT